MPVSHIEMPFHLCFILRMELIEGLCENCSSYFHFTLFLVMDAFFQLKVNCVHLGNEN